MCRYRIDSIMLSLMEKIETSISIVVPCFNEGKTIAKNLLAMHAFLSERFSSFEIIAVNDGSSDNTREELERAQKEISLFIIENEKNSGKGNAVRKGVLASKNELVGFLDADLAIPIESLLFFIPEIEKGNDIVIASRFVPGIRIKKPVLWYRRHMEKVFRFLRMLILQEFTIQDTQCGFKLFRRDAAMTLFPLLTIDRFAFDSEIIYLALKKGYSVRELPITLQNPAQSSVRIIRDSWNMALDLLRIRQNEVRGLYGKRSSPKSMQQEI